MEDIQTYRAEIDAIDDKLIDLLKRRSAWVRKVGALKTHQQKSGTSFIRAGREATMVRKMAEVFSDGSFPPAAAAQLWRIIISGSLSLESSLNVVVFAPPDNSSLYWLTREYFGNFNPVSKAGTLADVMNIIVSGGVQAGVLPLPSANAPWWLDLSKDVSVFACIPFVLRANETIEGLAIARTEPEPTGDDVTLLRLTTTDIVKIPTNAVMLDHAALTNGHHAYLVQVDGFYSTAPAFLKTLPSVLTIDVLGAYAKPVILSE